MNKIFLVLATLISFTLFSCGNDDKSNEDIDGPIHYDYAPLQIVFLDAEGNNTLSGENAIGNEAVVVFPVEYDARFWINLQDSPNVMPGSYPFNNLYYSVSDKALYYDFSVSDCGQLDKHHARIELRCPTIWPDNEYHTIAVENADFNSSTTNNWSKVTVDGTDISKQFVEGSTTVRKYVVK